MAALFSVQGTIQWTSFCHPVNDSDLFFLEVRPFNFSNHRWIMKSERKWTAVLLNRRVRTSKPTVCLTVAFAAPITRSSLSYKCFCRETCCCPDLQFCSKEWAEKEYLGFTESAQHQRSSTCTAQLCATVYPTSSLIASFFFSRAATSPGCLTAPPVSGAFYCTSNLQPLSLPQVSQLPLQGILSLWSLAFLEANGTVGLFCKLPTWWHINTCVIAPLGNVSGWWGDSYWVQLYSLMAV